MEAVTTFTSRVIALLKDDIDTDQIIPARFLKTTSREGLGQQLFYDWRYQADGSPRPDFPLDQPAAQGAQVLLVGDNFGCGSSREHAPWALRDWGFRAIIARSFADIFRNNALKNGLLPIALDDESHGSLRTYTRQGIVPEVTVDLQRQVVVLPDRREATFAVDAFARRCLLGGMDQLDYLLAQDQRIADYEARLDATTGEVAR